VKILKILNTEKEDYHLHSSSFSDGVPTINEIVQFSETIGMKKIIITDYTMQNYYETKGTVPRGILKRWKNVYNDVDVSFGVEGDLLNEKGDVSLTINDKHSDFIILSVHPTIYHGNEKEVTEGYIKAIENNLDKINCIGHICMSRDKNDLSKYLDIEKIVDVANNYNIPFEFNCANFSRKKTDLNKLDYLLKNAKQIYVNSDAHTLYEFKTLRKIGFEYLKEKGFI